MSDAKEVKFSLKVMVNQEKTKVLFAESDSHFVDVLLSFLTLPLGRIVKVVEKHYGDEAPIIGCLSTLYNSVANLDSSNFWTEGAKQILLDPTSTFDVLCRRLKLCINDSEPDCFYCERCDNTFWSVSIYYDRTSCKFCGGKMERDVAQELSLGERSGGVFTLDTETFIISDALEIMPYAIGLAQTIRTLNLTIPKNAKLMDVTLGLRDVVYLLGASMVSHTPLSDLVFKGTRKLEADTMHINYVPEKSLSENPRAKKMMLKVMVHKSKNRVLFAQANEDFVEFLFSLLTIPIGRVENLFHCNSINESIDNLFFSASFLIDEEYFKSLDIRKELIEPKLSHGYVSINHILPLTHERLPDDYYNRLWLFYSENFPQGQGKYMKGSRMYQVLDDLTVIPFSISSTICSLDQQGISVSDLKEVEMEIGLQEALSILKASLISNSALTNALLNRIPKEKT